MFRSFFGVSEFRAESIFGQGSGKSSTEAWNLELVIGRIRAAALSTCASTDPWKAPCWHYSI